MKDQIYNMNTTFTENDFREDFPKEEGLYVQLKKKKPFLHLGEVIAPEKSLKKVALPPNVFMYNGNMPKEKSIAKFYKDCINGLDLKKSISDAFNTEYGCEWSSSESMIGNLLE
tara:strand:+ start:5861 stop:6202 length:342 start_codon:yes stop_codon:yes gene_type:complete